MQKGKGRGEGLVGGLILTLMLLALPAGVEADSWERGAGGVVLPARFHPAAGFAGDRLLVIAGAAGPYSIPDLYESTIRASAAPGSWCLDARWERTFTPGYSRDNLEGTAGQVLPGGKVYIAAAARADIRNVSGCGTESLLMMDAVAGAEPADLFHIEARACIRDPAGRYRISVLAGDGAACLVLTTGRDLEGRSILRAGGFAGIGRSVLLSAGYDIETGELTGGISAAAGPAAAFSWAIHPVLGVTFSASVGVVR